MHDLVDSIETSLKILWWAGGLSWGYNIGTMRYLYVYVCMYIYICIKKIFFLLIPHLRCETQLFSSPGTLLLARSTPRETRPCWRPWNAQPQRLPGVPNPRDSLNCPTPEPPWSAQPQRLLECPAPETPWSAQPQLQAKTKKAYLNQCAFA